MGNSATLNRGSSIVALPQLLGHYQQDNPSPVRPPALDRLLNSLQVRNATPFPSLVVLQIRDGGAPCLGHSSISLVLQVWSVSTQSDAEVGCGVED